MHEDLSRYLDFLGGHGVRFELDPGLLQEADHDRPRIEGDEPMRAIEIPGLPPFVEHRDPAAGLSADHATLSLARVLFDGRHLRLGERFFDIGCGTGVLAVAAGLAGAKGIVATDVDEHGIELARRTAADANVAIRFCAGSLLDPVPESLQADVVAANLPHKPCPPGYELPLGQAGGEDGADVHFAFAGQAARRLATGARVLFFLHSLPHPRLLARYAEAFDLTLHAWKRRFLLDGEYGRLQEHFLVRHEEKTSYVAEADGRRFLIAGVWQARRR